MGDPPGMGDPQAWEMPPGMGDPPGHGRPPLGREENLPGQGEPPPPRHTVSERPVRILLECILVCVCVCVGCGGGGLCVIVDRFEGDRRSLTALHLNSSLMSREPLKLIDHVLCNLCLNFKIFLYN